MENTILPVYDGYKEIIRLHKMLEEAEIPHQLKRWYDGWQVCYPAYIPLEGCTCSVIETFFSNGNKADLLEVSGLQADTDDWYTAEDVFARIKAHWEERR